MFRPPCFLLRIWRTGLDEAGKKCPVPGYGVWREWSHRWTAEEARHSIAMRDYLTVTRAIDPVALERARMRQVEGGEVAAREVVLDPGAEGARLAQRRQSAAF